MYRETMRHRVILTGCLLLAAVAYHPAASAADTGQVTCSPPNYTGQAGFPGNLSLDCDGNLRTTSAATLPAGAATAANQTNVQSVPGTPAAKDVNVQLSPDGTHITPAGDAAARAIFVLPAPLSVSTTDRNGSITLGGTAQNAMASNATRKAYCVQNPPSATEVLTVRLNGTASTTSGTDLAAGAQACSSPGLIDTSAISVLAATTGHAFKAWEAQ